MAERGKVQLGKKDLVKDALPLLLKGKRLNKEEVNKLISKKVRGVSPKTVNAALIDLIEASKIKVENEKGVKIFYG